MTPDVVEGSDAPAFHLPTDLLGLTSARYSTENFADSERAALGPACSDIKHAVSELGLKIRPSTVNAEATTIDEYNDSDYEILITGYIKTAAEETPYEIDFNCVNSDKELPAPAGTSMRLIDVVAKKMGYTIAMRGKRLIKLTRPYPTGAISGRRGHTGY